MRSFIISVKEFFLGIYNLTLCFILTGKPFHGWKVVMKKGDIGYNMNYITIQIPGIYYVYAQVRKQIFNILCYYYYCYCYPAHFFAFCLCLLPSAYAFFLCLFPMPSAYSYHYFFCIYYIFLFEIDCLFWFFVSKKKVHTARVICLVLLLLLLLLMLLSLLL